MKQILEPLDMCKPVGFQYNLRDSGSKIWCLHFNTELIIDKNINLENSFVLSYLFRKGQ